MDMSLTVEGLSFRYGVEPILADVDLALQPGQVLCLLGANGCGKTTLLKVLGGLRRPTRGQVLLGGVPLEAVGPVDLAKRIGMVFQEHQPAFPYTALEVVMMGRTPYLGAFQQPSKLDFFLARQALAEMGIAHLEGRPYTNISGGERQLVFMARVLAQDPDVILLDEPTSHLDLQNQGKVLAMVRGFARRGFAMVMSTHAPEQAFACADQVAIMKRGEPPIVGDPKLVMTSQNLKWAYDVDINTITAPDPFTGEERRFFIPRGK